MPERLPLRRRLLFGAISVAVALVVAGTGLLAAELYLHRKYDVVSSLNIWGYRGPAVKAKPAGSRRVVVLGGSAAFGYGVDWNQAFPYYLEQQLSQSGRGTFSVVNLGFNNEGAASFVPTLQDFRFLDYDLAILYEGYNDLFDRPGFTPFRRQSMVYRATGYLPLLPMVLREKLFDWRYQGDIGRGYRGAGAGNQTVFRPTAAGQGAQAVRSLDQQLGPLTAGTGAAAAAELQCGEVWTRYCTTVVEAVRHARLENTLVLVATQPYISDRHVEQQAALGRAISSAFGGDPGVALVNLGRTVDLRDPAMTLDGLHLSVAGNRILADAFVEPVLKLARAVPAESR